MRPLIVAVAVALATPAVAQAPVDSLSGFSQAAAACATITEAGGAASAIAAAKRTAGLVDSPPEPASLPGYFFKDAARVDWWKRPTGDGRVHVGYDPAKNTCRVFLFGVPRRDAAQRARGVLPPGWFAYEEDKTWVRRREDGALSVMTVHAGDESKGVGPDTLTAMAHVWHNTAR